MLCSTKMELSPAVVTNLYLPPLADIRNLLDAELERAKEKSREEQNKVNEEKRASHFRPWDKGKGLVMLSFKCFRDTVFFLDCVSEAEGRGLEISSAIICVLIFSCVMQL